MIKGAISPLFFICFGFATLLIVSISDNYLVWWFSLIGLSISWLLLEKQKTPVSAINIAFISYIAVLATNIIIHDANWSHIAIFVTGFYLMGYLIMSVSTESVTLSFYRIVISVFFVLALWAIAQFITGDFAIKNISGRASTIFATPNSYAAAINLVILPLLSFYLFSNSSRSCAVKGYVLLIVLFASLMTTQSRGGWIAFAVGFCFVCVIGRRYVINIDKSKIVNLVAGFILVYLSLLAMKSIYIEKSLFVDSASQEIIPFTTLHSSSNHRLDLYRVALKNIFENPIIGIGQYNYHYYAQRDKQIATDSMTFYVHNDYLQSALETGIAGIGLLLLLIMLTYWKGLKSLPIMRRKDSVILVGILGAMSSYFVHAVGDFVMHVPILVFMAGGYIALASQLTNKYNYPENLNPAPCFITLTTKLRPRVIRFCFVLVFLTITFQPVYAQIFFVAANKALAEKNDELALQFFALSRQFAPYNMQYYKAETEYLKKIVIEKNDEEYARRANHLYQQAAEINKYDADSRLGLALLNRDYPNLLLNPMKEKEILSLLQYIRYWLPHSPRAKFEYIETQQKFGKILK